jgi:hypothetical protein
MKRPNPVNFPHIGDEVKWEGEPYRVLAFIKPDRFQIGDVDKYGVVWNAIKVRADELTLIKRK